MMKPLVPSLKQQARKKPLSKIPHQVQISSFVSSKENLRPRVPVSSLITVSKKFIFAESYSNFCTHLHLTNQTPRPPVHAIMEHIWILHGLLTKIHKEFQVLYQYVNLRMQGKDSKT